MDIRVSLSESEAEHLIKLSAEWRVEPEEAARIAIRSQYSAFRNLRFRPGSELTPPDAIELLLHAVWNDDGTFTLLRNGVDPGTERMKQLSDALTVLWFHYRDMDSIPTSISHAAATIVHFRYEAKDNTKDLRDSLRNELMDVFYRAYNVLSGAVADSDFN
jgi:hypothetical protein